MPHQVHLRVQKKRRVAGKRPNEAQPPQSARQAHPRSQVVTTLSSNNRELFTQEEAIIAEIKQLMTHWDSIADPLLHYEQGERQEMRNRLLNKLQELVKWEDVNRLAKKPLYLRKLERELRDNLEKIAE